MQSNETLFNFPCDYPLKIVGRNNAEFETLALSILRRHVPELAENAITQQASKNNHYIALTITIRANSKAQLDALYLELTGQKDILFVL